ncbi:two-component response regulator ORR22-like [Gossypium australe]|uniref:Two-component response regulator ORR22-like n=1 Tax=Gossypium australe TaxID=47621 RepID=A0A5B6WUV9_9ROSI|nr:two-component response regulator ORR22-like [Gossypium australe]
MNVSTTNQVNTALKMFRQNRNIYDLAITSVNMPDMDSFKLLELVGLEMGLPVISKLEVFENDLPYFLILDEIPVLSVHGNTKLVKKGITHGTCDYLLKLVRIEELKHIWQHVVRKNKFDFKDHINALN